MNFFLIHLLYALNFSCCSRQIWYEMQRVLGILDHSIRPVDPIESKRIRRRATSESDAFHHHSIGSNCLFVGFLSVGFRTGLRRKRTRPVQMVPMAYSYTIRSNSIRSDIQKQSERVRFRKDIIGFYN